MANIGIALSSLVTLLFIITGVIIEMLSRRYPWRVIRKFLSSVTTWLTLVMFLATIVASLSLCIEWFRFTVALMITSLLLMLFYVHRLYQFLDIESVLARELRDFKKTWDKKSIPNAYKSVLNNIREIAVKSLEENGRLCAKTYEKILLEQIPDNGGKTVQEEAKRYVELTGAVLSELVELFKLASDKSMKSVCAAIAKIIPEALSYAILQSEDPLFDLTTNIYDQLTARLLNRGDVDAFRDLMEYYRYAAEELIEREGQRKKARIEQMVRFIHIPLFRETSVRPDTGFAGVLVDVSYRIGGKAILSSNKALDYVWKNLILEDFYSAEFIYLVENLSNALIARNIVQSVGAFTTTALLEYVMRTDIAQKCIEELTAFGVLSIRYHRLTVLQEVVIRIVDIWSILCARLDDSSFDQTQLSQLKQMILNCSFILFEEVRRLEDDNSRFRFVKHMLAASGSLLEGILDRPEPDTVERLTHLYRDLLIENPNHEVHELIRFQARVLLKSVHKLPSATVAEIRDMMKEHDLS